MICCSLLLSYAEPFTFEVLNVEEVRQNGVNASDFYITNIGGKYLYDINEEKQLYQIKADHTKTLITEDVIHVDCSRLSDYMVFLTESGDLYGMGKTNTGALLTNKEPYLTDPILLMEDVDYAICGHGDVLVLKKDKTVWSWGGQNSDGSLKNPVKLLENAVMISGKADSHAALLADGTVWTWGDNQYGQCGYIGSEVIYRPICVAQDVAAIWMENLQYNMDYLDAEKCYQYDADDGRYFHNLVIKKKDGSLWACGKNIGEFAPCQIVERSYIVYDGENTYRDILEAYKEAYTQEQNAQAKGETAANTDGWQERWEENWENVDARLVSYVSLGLEVCYCMVDITGDGTAELCIATEDGGEYQLRDIYAYDDGRIIWILEDMEREVTIYEDGIIEEISGGAGIHYTYSQLQKNSAVRRYLEEITIDDVKEPAEYFVKDKNGSDILISETEFYRIQNQYAQHETTVYPITWSNLCNRIEETCYDTENAAQKVDNKDDIIQKISQYLSEQVPELEDWSDYVEKKSGGKAYLYQRYDNEEKDVYRNGEGSEYLGKYYSVYVGEMWEDHSVMWSEFYVSENFDEVLWKDTLRLKGSGVDMYSLEEWRNSSFYPQLYE